MPKGKKKVEITKKVEKNEKAEKVVKDREATPEEQQVIDEQQRQKRIADCTMSIQQALQDNNCGLDSEFILRAGQVIPKISVVPMEVLQAQREAQKQAL
jgi:hypothetical protein